MLSLGGGTLDTRAIWCQAVELNSQMPAIPRTLMAMCLCANVY